MLMSVDVALAVQPSGNIAHASNRQEEERKVTFTGYTRL